MKTRTVVPVSVNCLISPVRAKLAPKPNFSTLTGKAGRPNIRFRVSPSSSSTILFVDVIVLKRAKSVTTLAASSRWWSRRFSLSSM